MFKVLKTTTAAGIVRVVALMAVPLACIAVMAIMPEEALHKGRQIGGVQSVVSAKSDGVLDR